MSHSSRCTISTLLRCRHPCSTHVSSLGYSPSAWKCASTFGGPADGAPDQSGRAAVASAVWISYLRVASELKDLLATMGSRESSACERMLCTHQYQNAG